jgi:ribosomal protein S18 acetylase RimI-like enzyme
VTVFAPQRHSLAGGALAPLAPEDCGLLAAELAAMDPWAKLGYAAASLARYLSRPDPALARYLLRRDDQPAGFLAVRHPWLRGPYIEVLAVLPPHQGTGLGRQMVEWCESQAAAVSANLWVCVSDFNLAARDFYARLGFAEQARLDGLVADGRTELLLRKRLG